MADSDDPGYKEDEKIIISPPSLFQKDIVKIPCLRKSIIYSFNIGIGLGLTRFMLTSNTKNSVFFGIRSFSVSFVIVFLTCRIMSINEKFKVYRLEPALKSYAEIYGNEKKEN